MFQTKKELRQEIKEFERQVECLKRELESLRRSETKLCLACRNAATVKMPDGRIELLGCTKQPRCKNFLPETEV